MTPISFPRTFRIFTAVVGVVVALSLVPLVMRPSRPEIRIDAVAALGPAQASLELGIESPLLTHVAVLAVRDANLVAPRKVYLYYDVGYPLATSRAAAVGIYQHVASDLALRDYPETVSIVDAEDLKQILQKWPAAPTRALIIPGGVFPDTVYGQDLNLVKPWVERGGLLFWVGDAFGYYSASPGRSLTSDPTKHPKDRAPLLFWGNSPMWALNSSFEEGQEASEFAKALDLRYTNLGRGTLQPFLQANHGTILGWTGQGAASIASIPLGKGYVVLWSGQVFHYDELNVAHDIVQVLDSGGANARVLAVRTFAKARPPLSESLALPLQPQDVALIIYAFDDNIRNTVFAKRVIMLSTSTNATP